LRSLPPRSPRAPPSNNSHLLRPLPRPNRARVSNCTVSRNITSSKEYGIKDWTDEQITSVLTQGISSDGRRLAPPMSGRAPIWAQLTERDKHDLVAYLRSVPPQE
jgi:hypothetical protein